MVFHDRLCLFVSVCVSYVYSRCVSVCWCVCFCACLSVKACLFILILVFTHKNKQAKHLRMIRMIKYSRANYHNCAWLHLSRLSSSFALSSQVVSFHACTPLLENNNCFLLCTSSARTAFLRWPLWTLAHTAHRIQASFCEDSYARACVCELVNVCISACVYMCVHGHRYVSLATSIYAYSAFSLPLSPSHLFASPFLFSLFFFFTFFFYFI